MPGSTLNLTSMIVNTNEGISTPIVFTISSVLLHFFFDSSTESLSLFLKGENL